MTTGYYTSRAQAAYAAAEAATDPRDKAAFCAAARTWEQLATPTTAPTYSMKAHCQQLAALKRDAAERVEQPEAMDGVTEWCEPCHSYHHPTAPGCFRLRPTAKKPVTIEF